MKKRIIIPARYHSTRLFAKLLLIAAGKPILQHTYERALECAFDSLIIATDHPAIAELCHKIGAPYCMTSTKHLTGTDRLSEVIDKMAYDNEDIILNIQGDEPLVALSNLLCVTQNLIDRPEALVATLCEPLTDLTDIFNPNYVKVVRDKNEHALFFSRAPIPWARDDFPNSLPTSTDHFRHIGVYAYKVAFLKEYPRLSIPPVETLENLEQLRILYHGYKIHVGLAREVNPPGVDNAESFEKVSRILENLVTARREENLACN